MDENFAYDENQRKVRELFETAEVRSALEEFAQAHKELHRLWRFDSEHLIPKLGPMFASKSGKELAALILRTHSNIESLLSFDQVRHFQAVAILTRTILELGIDVRLSRGFQDSADRMSCFSELEHLRVTRRLIRIATEQNLLDTPEIKRMTNAMHNSKDEILAKAARLWPKFPDPFKLKHWSGMNLERRALLAGRPFNKIYTLSHIQMSWWNHGGTTGILELTPSTLANDCTRNFSSATELYKTVLQDSIHTLALPHNYPELANQFVELCGDS
jgi:hypothetical protein